ncbi:hypothetical protein DN462_26100 [Citrobacter freundii]|nr:hypothetical protein DN462_26100 [Citrobacter freundii]
MVVDLYHWVLVKVVQEQLQYSKLKSIFKLKDYNNKITVLFCVVMVLPTLVYLYRMVHGGL